jgi:hypothetical protein
VIATILICLALVAWAIIRSRSGGSGFALGAGEMAPIPASTPAGYVSASSAAPKPAAKPAPKPAPKPAQKQGQKQGKR